MFLQIYCRIKYRVLFDKIKNNWWVSSISAVGFIGHCSVLLNRIFLSLVVFFLVIVLPRNTLGIIGLIATVFRNGQYNKMAFCNRSIVDRTIIYRETNGGEKETKLLFACSQATHIVSTPAMHSTSYLCKAQYVDAATYKMANMVKHQRQTLCKGALCCHPCSWDPRLHGVSVSSLLCSWTWAVLRLAQPSPLAWCYAAEVAFTHTRPEQITCVVVYDAESALPIFYIDPGKLFN